MAVITVRAVKLAAFSGAAVPLIGYSGRLLAQSKGGDDKAEQSKNIRACDIPMYPSVSETAGTPGGSDSEPNALQKQISKIRIAGSDLVKQAMASDAMKQVKDGYSVIEGKVQIGVDHSKATLDYVQNNPGELPRVGLISMAVLGGVIVGYKKSSLRKIVYATIAGVSAAALCYPTFTVDLSRALSEDCKNLWRNNIGWPLTEEKPKSDKTSAESSVLKVLKLSEDHGQSKAEDKDLYSNRSST